MAHPLQVKIAEVRRQATWLWVLCALGRWLAVMTLCVLAVGLADYWIRFEDRGIRIIASATVVAIFCWATYRFWLLGFERGLKDVQIAQRVERRFPALGDRLASAVAFLKQPDADVRSGSVALRQAVIQDATSAIDRLDLSQVFERRPARRALAVAALCVLAALVVAVAAPQSARLAVARLARPWGNDLWPRFYHVEFRKPPTRLASGQPFEVELVADADHRLPDDVRIHYRYETPTGPTEEESEPMQKLGAAIVARKDHVSRPFWYRAEGGDDRSMDWIRLEVVEPPRVDSLGVTLHPPAYSGLSVETSDKHIRALRGTRVELAGTSTKKLVGARVHQDSGAVIPATISADGYEFSLAADAAEPLIVDKTGPWWIELEDGEGLRGGGDERWEISAVADLAPTISIEQPTANIFVTPEAVVDLAIVAKDDLAIRDVALHFNRSDRTDVEDFAVPLYQGPATVAAVSGGTAALSRLGERQAIEHRWSLAELGAKSGTRVTYWATAGDYLPQSGKSSVRGLTIITKAELEERLAQRQTLILGELQRVLKLEEDARRQTRSLEIQLEQVGRLAASDLDAAQAAEMNQRQVNRTLTSTSEGIPAQIEDFLAELASNRIDSPDVERHMQAILKELGRLGREHLTPIERELTSMIKAAQAAAPADHAAKSGAAADPLVKKSLASAGRDQDAVVESLEGMLKELGQWDSYRRFAREITQLAHDQQEIAEATTALAPKTLGRDAKDLEPQQQADLKKLANLQTELGRRLEKIQQQMGQASDELKQSDPLSSATISDGLHQAQQQAISGQMRQASGRLEKNQLGQAADAQTKIAKELDDLAATLSNRREQELTRLVKQLHAAQQELTRMRQQQQGLRKQIAATAQKPGSDETKRQLERLARQEKQLQESAGRLARRLERLQADEAGRSAAGAANKMGQAGDAGQQGDGDAAGEQAERAEKDLEQAGRQLAQRIRAAEEDLAREQMARLEDSLKGFEERQKKLLAECERLEKLRATEGRFTRAQASSVHDLARGQKALQGETSLLAEKLSLNEVITLALEGAALQMTRAADLLQHERTDGPTQTTQEAARLRFAQLLAALAGKPPADNGEKGAGDDEGKGGGGSKNRADGAYVLAQLKLIKLLQEDLNGRFRSLSGTTDDATTARELTQLVAEQGKLAELALKLAEPPESAPEDDPDTLPDVRQGNRSEPDPAGQK